MSWITPNNPTKTQERGIEEMAHELTEYQQEVWDHFQRWLDRGGKDFWEYPKGSGRYAPAYGSRISHTSLRALEKVGLIRLQSLDANWFTLSTTPPLSDVSEEILADGELLTQAQARIAELELALKPFVIDAPLFVDDADRDIAYAYVGNSSEVQPGTPVIYSGAIQRAAVVLSQE